MAAISHAQLSRYWFDEQNFKSPSGEFTLRETPSNSDGDGPATYVLKQNGRTVWKGQKPFTLWEASVSNSGRVFGFGYRDGLTSIGQYGADTIDVWLVDPRGQSHQIDAIKRYGAMGVTDTPDYPYLDNPILLARRDDAVITIYDEIGLFEVGKRTHTESLITYDLVSKKRVSKIDLAKSFGAKFDAAEPNQVQPITGTELLLCTWVIKARQNDTGLAQVVDINGKPLWSISFPDNAGVLKVDTPHEFALHIGDRKDFYKIVCDKNNDEVVFIGSKPLKPAPPAQEPPAPPTISPTLIGTIDVPNANSSNSVVAVGRNRIALATATKLVVTDFYHHLIYSCTLPKFKSDNNPPVSVTIDRDGTIGVGGSNGSITFSPNGKHQTIWKSKNASLYPWDRVAISRSRKTRWVIGPDNETLSVVSPSGKTLKTIKRTKHRWIGNIVEADSAPDGAVTLISFYEGLDDQHYYVRSFSRDGTSQADFSVPLWFGHEPKFQFAFGFFPSIDSERILACGHNGIFCFDRTGRALWHMREQVISKAGYLVAQVSLVDDTNMLAVYDKHHTISLYRLPAHRR